MSSSSNSRIARRRLLGMLAASPLLALDSIASTIANPAVNQISNPIANLQRWGSGEFRRFGFLVYEATLWAGSEDPLRPPLALKLTYKRNIAGKDIANASVKEIRNLGIVADARLKPWGERMESIFPDVHPGDAILGLQLEQGAQFFYNDRFIGSIDEPAFARAFFAIWLDAKTSAPDLRTALLKRSGI